MILVDVNLLLYAHDAGSRDHCRAVRWLERVLSRSNVAVVSPTEQHWATLSRLLPKSRVRGSLIMDAHLAALAIEHGATLYTNDLDSARFPGLRVEYPLQ